MLSRLPLVHRTIFAVRGDSEELEDFLLVIADPKIKNEDGVGRVIEQSNSKAFFPQVVFDAKGIIDIRRQNILETIEVQCREDGLRYIIPLEEYKRISYEISNDPQSSQSQPSRYERVPAPPSRFNFSGQQHRGEKQSSNENSSEEEENYIEAEPQMTSEAMRKRGRPKGSRNKMKLGQHASESDKEDEFEEEHKRGRGRPKGSKNKKNLLKREETEHMKDTFELRVLMSGYLKRGKGRPKGSRNKPKLKQEYTRLPVKEEAIFWKRGKGRPKGSKNKIKNHEKVVEKYERLNIRADLKQKRTRGRPKGVRNRPKSEPSLDESSELNQMGELPEVPDLSAYQTISCCRKCTNRVLKQLLLSLETYAEWKDVFDENVVYNLHENFGPERRQNLFLLAIRRNNHQMLHLLIEKQFIRTNYFRYCWETEGKIEMQKYSVRTSKECLSRSGKEGVYALLQDCYSNWNEPWWRTIGIERIFEAMDNWTSFNLINALRLSSPELEKEMFANIPMLIRAGNSEVAKILLKDLLSCQETYDYSPEHYQCLSVDVQLQYKKMNILKKNSGLSYCSVIHCASINSSEEVLENLIKTFPNYNIGDSIGRKPIHYASAVPNSTTNMQILLKYGSDLRDLDKQKMTPLMLACYYGRPQIVKFILDRFTQPLYVNFKSDQGFSALHYAVLNNHEECVNIMVDYLVVDINTETKDKQTALHLACGTGNVQIIGILIARGAYADYYDRCKRTPFMFALRNNNYEAFRMLINEGVKLYKCDSSLNSMLHCAAAYGNCPILKYLIGILKQTKNKSNLYPWEVAVGKGHLACAQLLDDHSTVEEERFDFSGNIMMNVMRNISGTQEAMDMLVYLLDTKHFGINAQDYNGFTLLHYCCSISEDDYIKSRMKELSGYSLRELKEEYRSVQDRVINLLISYGINKTIQNKNKETAFEMCVENANLTGIRLLMSDDIDLDYQTSNGLTILYYLGSIASLSNEEIKFVYNRIIKQDPIKLKESLKKVDNMGYEPLLHFVKDFTCNIKNNFSDNIQRIKIRQLQSRKARSNQKIQRHVDEEHEAFRLLQEHEEYFIRIIKYMVEVGANINSVVQDQPTNRDKDTRLQRKWGVYHYVMKFPSIKILEFFSEKVKETNVKDIEGRTPLHYFCMWNHKGNLLNTSSLDSYKQYTGERSLTFLLQHCFDISSTDCYGSTPLLYAALNKQISFMTILAKFGGQFNICNNNNQVPLIEIMKLKDALKTKEIEELMSIGADPNFEDMQQRNCLHHLVYHSRNFDTSPQICKVLFEYGVKINSLDKHSRTPLFYCFTNIDKQQTDSATDLNNDKVQILQALLSHKDIDLNHMDIYGRSAIHYACEKDYFFSIMYLLNKGVDTTITDSEGNTPLAICFIRRNLNQAALLLRLGVKQGFVFENGEKTTYFSYAFNKLSVAVCYMLLDNGYPLELALQETANHLAFRKVLIKKYSEGPK